MKYLFNITLLRLFFFRAISALGQFLLLFVLARHLGVSGVGVFAVGQGMAMSLGLLSHFGLNSAIVRVASISPAAPPVLRILFQSLAIAFSISVVLAGGAFFCATLWPEANRLTATMFDSRLFLLAVPALTSSYILSGFFKAAGLPTTAIVVEPSFVALFAALTIEILFIVSPATTSPEVLIALSYAGAAWLVLAFAVARFLTWHTNVSRVGDADANFEDLPNLKSYLRMSASFLAISFTELVQNGVMIVIASLVLLDNEVGLFRTAERLTILIGFLLIVINAVLPPLIVKAYATRNIRALETTVRHYAAMATLFGVAVSVPLLLFPSWILSFFGTEFTAAAPVLQILVLGQLVLAVTGSSMMILKMTDHLDLARNISLISTLLFLAGFYLLVSWYRVIGAGIAVTLWLLLQHVTATVFVNLKVGIMVVPFLPRRFRTKVSFSG